MDNKKENLDDILKNLDIDDFDLENENDTENLGAPPGATGENPNNLSKGDPYIHPALKEIRNFIKSYVKILLES